MREREGRGRGCAEKGKEVGRGEKEWETRNTEILKTAFTGPAESSWRCP